MLAIFSRQSVFIAAVLCNVTRLFNRWLAILLLLSITLYSDVLIAAPQSLTITTPDARVTGSWQQTQNGPVAQFVGLRFARAERWQAPELERLRGNVDATTFASICPQQNGNRAWYQQVAAAFGVNPEVIPPRPNVSEDCLHLNIWTSNPNRSSSKPVMVWIHGGSNKNGYSYEPNYLGHRLAANDVVVVSIAYRLGVLGFLAHPEFDTPGSGNFGLLDQISALSWVQEHIADFGGDPNNVTLFGESAGAADIGYLYAAPQAQGLFHKAISQSGGWQISRVATLKEAADFGETFANELGGLSKLDSMKAHQVVSAAAEYFYGHYWDPKVDGHVITKAIPTLVQTNALTRKPLLLGFNSDEGLMYQPSQVDEDIWQEALLTTLGEQAETVNLTGKPLRERLNTLRTAANYACPSLEWAAYNADGSRSYVYEFATARTQDHGLGAYHGAEIPYIFDTHDAWLPTTEADKELTNTMLQYWINFAATGNPNGSNLLKWPVYTKEEKRKGGKKGSSAMILELLPEPRAKIWNGAICDAIRRR